MSEKPITFGMYYILVKLNMGLRIRETQPGKPEWEHPFKQMDKWDRRINKSSWRGIRARQMVKLYNGHSPLWALNEKGRLAMSAAMTGNSEWREFADWLHKEYAS